MLLCERGAFLQTSTAGNQGNERQRGISHGPCGMPPGGGGSGKAASVCAALSNRVADISALATISYTVFNHTIPRAGAALARAICRRQALRAAWCRHKAFNASLTRAWVWAWAFGREDGGCDLRLLA